MDRGELRKLGSRKVSWKQTVLVFGLAIVSIILSIVLGGFVYIGLGFPSTKVAIIVDGIEYQILYRILPPYDPSVRYYTLRDHYGLESVYIFTEKGRISKISRFYSRRFSNEINGIVERLALQSGNDHAFRYHFQPIIDQLERREARLKGIG